VGAWDSRHYEYPRDRFCEYTSEALKARFSTLTPQAIKELKAIPSLFAYEGAKDDTRIGYIRRISDRGRAIYIEFEFEHTIPAIPFAKLEPLRLSLDLGDRWELNRTHWAIKNEDLLGQLVGAGLVDSKFAPPRLEARAFLRAAIEASVFALPDSPGLTYDELVIIGAAFDYKKGEISDALEIAPRAKELVERNERFHLHRDVAERLLNFSMNAADDLRDPVAFEAVHLFFRELAQEHGIREAVASRDQVLDHVVTVGKVDRDEAKAALSVFVLAEHLQKEGTSQLRLVPGQERWPLPSEQLKGATVFYRGYPRLEQIHDEIGRSVVRFSDASDVDMSEDAYEASDAYSNSHLDLDSLELDVREIPFTVSTLLQKAKKGQLILTPAFQRRQVWNTAQQSQFIEAVLLNYPLQPLFLNQDREGRYLIIDGLQRTSTLKSFCDGRFALHGLERLHGLNGKRWGTLSPDLHSRIEDRTLNCYILKPTVPLSVINDIFARINTGGTPLNRQEIRHALHQGPATRLLDELAADPNYQDWIGTLLNPKRMGDLEAVLRCIAFARIEPDIAYRDDMDEFLVNTMKELNSAPVSEREGITKQFGRVWPLARQILGDDAFRLPTQHTRGRINLAIMESVYRFFVTYPVVQFYSHTQRIKENYSRLLADVDYLNSVRYATGDKNRVKTRFRIARLQLEAGCVD
jgi:ADP-ribose pyrophosphatase YjhB (NUDIX family)